MNVQLLIDEIVRQTTVLIAQLSTSAGLRAPLSHVASQVFLELARELDAQGVRRRVVADMFGLALRSYQTKVRRLSEAHERSGGSLWQDVYTTLAQGSATRAELERRHRPYVPKQIAAALQDMVESGLAYSSGRGAETLFGLTSDADRQHLSATEALRVQRDLCRYLVASGSATTREHLQQQLRLSTEAIDALVSALVAEGYLAQQGSELRARHFELGVGTEQGWETAVLDHFRAVTTAIAAKVSRPIAQADDEVGGSTRSFLVHAEHPCRQEVMNILRETRQRTAEVWTRVSAHNEAFPPPEDADRVTFYFGQNVVRGAAEDLTTGASESANSEEVSQ
jgi:hypothetical protein